MARIITEGTEVLTPAMCAARAAAALDKVTGSQSAEFAQAQVDAARAWIDLAINMDERNGLRPAPVVDSE